MSFFGYGLRDFFMFHVFLSAGSGHKEPPVPDGDTDVISVVLTLLSIRKYMNIQDLSLLSALY